MRTVSVYFYCMSRGHFIPYWPRRWPSAILLDAVFYPLFCSSVLSLAQDEGHLVLHIREPGPPVPLEAVIAPSNPGRSSAKANRGGGGGGTSASSKTSGKGAGKQGASRASGEGGATVGKAGGQSTSGKSKKNGRKDGSPGATASSSKRKVLQEQGEGKTKPVPAVAGVVGGGKPDGAGGDTKKGDRDHVAPMDGSGSGGGSSSAGSRGSKDDLDNEKKDDGRVGKEEVKPKGERPVVSGMPTAEGGDSIVTKSTSSPVEVGTEPRRPAESTTGGRTKKKDDAPEEDPTPRNASSKSQATTQEARYEQDGGRAERRGNGRQVDEEENWLIFNDFLVERTVLEDARGFGPAWKEPCVLVYRRVHGRKPKPVHGTAEAAEAQRLAMILAMSKRMFIPASVFEIPSLSKVCACVAL